MSYIRNDIEIQKSKLRLLQHFIKLCYYKNASHSELVPNDKLNLDLPWCPRTFDGYTCWDATPAGGKAFQRCPEYVVGFDSQLTVYKTCTLNGTWTMHPEAQRPWTNYTTCVNVEDLSFRYVVNDIYVGGYSVSVAALLISLAIFKSFRSLKCLRIRIHMHLFSSFALNNILWIVWYKTVVNVVSVVQENKVWCQLLHIITNYFMVTSYFWMFCEGLYLYIALVLVFVNEDLAMKWFISLGWGLSLSVTAVYGITRYFVGTTERCWMDQSDTFWIITTPVVVSLIASFVIFTVFLVNVVRVILHKMVPEPEQLATYTTVKKATRATLILIPLFGLHFILIPLRPSPKSTGENVYQVISALMTSLQGLCVAVLFCFTNQDVVTAIKTQITKFMGRAPEPTVDIPMTGVTGGDSAVSPSDDE